MSGARLLLAGSLATPSGRYCRRRGAGDLR